MTLLRLVGARLFGSRRSSNDVWIKDGVIVALPLEDADVTIDVDGAWVTPGFIDLHTHVLPGAQSLSIDADRVGVQQGVTTVVDAGTAGARDVVRLLDAREPLRQTKVYSWVNIASPGLIDGRHELVDSRAIDVDSTLNAIRSSRHRAVGVKVRMSSSVVGTQGTRPLELAIEAAERSNLPVMVHVGNEPPAVSDCLDVLRPGDVVTHAFHGKPGGLLRNEEPIEAAAAAVARGVRLDVGHGEASLSFRVARAAFSAGLTPHTISTDIHAGNVDNPVSSLAVTVSKMLALGIELEDAVRMVTVHPAAVIGKPELGSLDLGTPADLTVFTIDNSHKTLVDSEGDTLETSESIRPILSIIDGTAHELD